jgi:hypothetical protein
MPVSTPSPDRSEPTRQDLADQLMELAAEVGMLRESITTAAEWDLQARTDRQQVLDTTLAAVRRGQCIVIGVCFVLVGTNLLLVALTLWLLSRTGS